jgi:hypothetical protein
VSEGRKVHPVPSGDTVSGAALSPCSDVTSEQRPGGEEAGATAPPRARASASDVSAAESFAGSRQLDANRAEPANDLMRYARMIKPFPTRRLAEALYHVEADVGLIHRLATNAQIQPPTTPDVWYETLEHILECLWSLELRIKEAVPMIVALQDTADVDYERSISAITAIMRGAHGGE